LLIVSAVAPVVVRMPPPNPSGPVPNGPEVTAPTAPVDPTLIGTVPLLSVVPPEWTLATLSRSVPLPPTNSDPLPLTTPESVNVEAAAPVVSVTELLNTIGIVMTWFAAAALTVIPKLNVRLVAGATALT